MAHPGAIIIYSIIQHINSSRCLPTLFRWIYQLSKTRYGKSKLEPIC